VAKKRGLASVAAKPDLKNRIRELRQVRAGSLLSHPKNFRQHPVEQQQALEGVLGSIGIADALLAFPADGLGAAGDSSKLMVFDGHLRKDRNPDQVWPVLVTDLTRAEADALLMTLDWTASLAELDPAMLASLAADARAAAVLSEQTYQQWAAAMQEASGAEGLWDGGPNGRAIVEDEAPAVRPEPVAKRGELWRLGPHRLLVGDSTHPEDWQRLMGGEVASMVWTDPPYNVAYVGGTGLTIQNDSMADGKFRAFLRGAMDCLFAVCAPGSPIYVCHADSEGYNFRGSFTDAGWLLKETLIWVKNALMLGRQDYQWRHEPILYGWKPGASHTWNGGRRQTTVFEEEFGIRAEQQADGAIVLMIPGSGGMVSLRVPSVEVLGLVPDDQETVWRFPKPIRSADHPTMKPVGLPARAIRNSSAVGDIVVDGFLGSGSTLSAAHQTERRCFGMELDPVYADVIIRRWEALSGVPGVRA